MLKLIDLKRTYQGEGGVSEASLNVPHGSVYVVCGSNGAGKTTTLSVISGLLYASHGTLLLAPVEGDERQIDLNRYVPRVGFGFVPDQPFLDPSLTPWQWLAFASGVKGCPVTAKEATELAKDMRIESKDLHRSIGALSFGNRRKVALWAELATTRDLLVLDEPLTGLDPDSIQAFHDTLRKFTEGGRSVLLSTHLLAEAEEVATHVGFIHAGKTVKEGELSDLRAGGKRLKQLYSEAIASR